MSKETVLHSSMPLSHTQNGTISISKITDPYGAGSGTVASIGVSLDGDTANPEWKVHIPLEDIDALISALQSLK